jgi:hypothetical protein
MHRRRASLRIRKTAEQPSILEIAEKPYVLENEAKIAADASEKSKSPN